MQILADRPFSYQHPHPLAQLLQRLLGAGRLMLRPDAGRAIGIQIPARQQRAMPIHMPALEEVQLGHRPRVTMNDARIIHELRQPDPRRMPHQRRQVLRLDLRAGGLHIRRRHAGRQLHPDIHHRPFAGLLEIPDAIRPDHVGNLVRVADRRGHPPRRNAAVELERRHQRAFDMQMRVDEPRHQYQAADVDHLAPLVILADPDNPVATDRHVALHARPGHQVEHLAPAQHLVRRFVPAPLRDACLKIGHIRCSLLFPKSARFGPPRQWRIFPTVPPFAAGPAFRGESPRARVPQNITMRAKNRDDSQRQAGRDAGPRGGPRRNADPIRLAV